MFERTHIPLTLHNSDIIKHRTIRKIRECKRLQTFLTSTMYEYGWSSSMSSLAYFLLDWNLVGVRADMDWMTKEKPLQMPELKLRSSIFFFLHSCRAS